MLVSRTSVFSVAAVLLAASFASGQAIGPDMISSSHADVARNGTGAGGTITGYSIGSVTCNRGDMPAITHPNSSIRPMVGQGMFRLKTFSAAGGGTFQRFEQVGQGWTKWVGVPVNGTSPTCGVCVGGGSGQMGVNCADTYGSGFNSPGGMAAKSAVNPATGVLVGTRGGGTSPETAINTRIQVLTTDVTNQPAGTRFFVETVHLLPHDAQYVRSNESVAINAMNNASSQEININAGTGNPILIGGAANQQVAAITRWRAIDPAVTVVTADHDDTPNPGVAGKTIRCRYYVAAKVTDFSGTGAGPWHYEYSVYNLNSDRAAGSFAIELPPSGTFTEYTFRHPPAHSGENVSNAPWTATRDGKDLVFSTQPFATNPTANAIRWGTLYNFGFTSNTPPGTGTATIGLFKPGQPGGVASIAVPNLPVPLVPVCTADFNHDGNVDPDDLADFITCFFLDIQFPGLCADADFNRDTFRDPDDLADFITGFFLTAQFGCQ